MKQPRSGKGEIMGIARHQKPRAPIEELRSARVTVEAGVEGDCHGAPGPSQITIVSEEGWRAANAELGVELPWVLRRANLLIRGIALFNTTGVRLQIGEVVVEITGENEPCFVMDRQHRGLRKVLKPAWRAGVACRVIQSGTVKKGDRVTVLADG